MELKSQITALLSQKMDRKDFLRNVAIGTVALTGLAGVLKLLSPKGGKPTKNSDGYSSSSYGGKK